GGSQDAEARLPSLVVADVRDQRDRSWRDELLDAAVIIIRDEHIASRVGGHADGNVELPIPAAGRTPLGEVGAVSVELLDAVVAGVRDVDVAGGVGGDLGGSGELPVATSGGPPLGQIVGS